MDLGAWVRAEEELTACCCLSVFNSRGQGCRSRCQRLLQPRQPTQCLHAHGELAGDRLLSHAVWELALEASTASPVMSHVNFVFFFSLEPASATTLLPPRRQEDPVDPAHFPPLTRRPLPGPPMGLHPGFQEARKGPVLPQA